MRILSVIAAMVVLFLATSLPVYAFGLTPCQDALRAEQEVQDRMDALTVIEVAKSLLGATGKARLDVVAERNKQIINEKIREAADSRRWCTKK